MDPADIAKQLMRMENDLFQKILASDCAAWVKNVDDEQLQNLPRFLNNNYKVGSSTTSPSKLKLMVFYRLRIGASIRSCLLTLTKSKSELR